MLRPPLPLIPLGTSYGGRYDVVGLSGIKRRTRNAGSKTDAFVTKLSPGPAIMLSTFLGGANDEHAGGNAVDASGNASWNHVTTRWFAGPEAVAAVLAMDWLPRSQTPDRRFSTALIWAAVVARRGRPNK